MYLKFSWTGGDHGNHQYELVLDTEITKDVTLFHEYQLTQRGDDFTEGMLGECGLAD